MIFATLSICAQVVDTTKMAVDSVLADTTKNNVDTTDNKIPLQDSIDIDSIDQDSVDAAQDTIREETRRERRERERAEKEHEKYYYKDIKKDSTRLAIEHISRVAWKRSALVPGWGQYTNQGLWWVKIPIIYGGLITGFVVFDYWQWYYKKFLDELDHRISNQGEPRDPDLINYTNMEGLVRQKDFGRRNRDLTILAIVGFWGLNVVEAYVDSMLKYRWNIGSDMNVRLSPALMPNPSFASNNAFGRYGVTPGVKLTIKL